MKVITIFFSFMIVGISFILTNCKKNDDNSINDGDGNVYTTITIGTQIWMKENLKTTKYNDGTPIPEVTDNYEWNTLNSPGYCWYNNDPPENKDTYGALYNWFAVNTNKLCPIGFHVPSNSEWHQLILFLDPDASDSSYESKIAGGMLKESGTVHWASPNNGATNETGFTGLPGGYRNFDGRFYDIGAVGSWWSSTLNVNVPILALSRNLVYSNYVMGNGEHVLAGLSVRCLRD